MTPHNLHTNKKGGISGSKGMDSSTRGQGGSLMGAFRQKKPRWARPGQNLKLLLTNGDGMKLTQERNKVNEMLEAALGYASRGWPVLPLHWPTEGGCSCGREICPNPGKHPLTTHGKDDASTDPATIRGWWSHWPEANIGVATGKKSGLLVVDIDPRNGGDPQNLPKDLPDTPIARTGGDGWHYYFQHPENGLKVPGKLPGSPGIDLKGTGGYVVAPPSRHGSGRNYEWQPEYGSLPLASFPASLVELITSASRSQSTEPGVEQDIPEGKRNSTLTSMTGAMRRRGMTMGEINCALQKANKDRCIPPLTDLEVRGIARSVARYAPEVEEWEEPEELPEPQQIRVPALPEGLLPMPLAPLTCPQ
jgi:hypothetical protein